MSKKQIHPSTLDGIKRLAKSIKHEHNASHFTALDEAARCGGFQNFRHANNRLSNFLDNVKPPKNTFALEASPADDRFDAMILLETASGEHLGHRHHLKESGTESFRRAAHDLIQRSLSDDPKGFHLERETVEVCRALKSPERHLQRSSVVQAASSMPHSNLSAADAIDAMVLLEFSFEMYPEMATYFDGFGIGALAGAAHNLLQRSLLQASPLNTQTVAAVDALKQARQHRRRPT